MLSVTSQLVSLCQRSIDPLARRRAVFHWLDWMACSAAGAMSPVGRVLRSMTKESSVTAQMSLLGPAGDTWDSILLDAGAANVEEMDDMHREAILHPGPVILPAIAGLARQGLSAAQVLDAIVVGYEVMIRIGRALGPHHYYHWHNTATAGAFGASAACAYAERLSMEQTIWALGNAGTQAAGLWQVRMEPVMSKQLHPAHAAWAGRNAVRLARCGFTGPAYILEGERGFFAAMCPDGDLDAVLRPDVDWLIHTTSFKPWPACRHTHATIDCVLSIRERLAHAPLDFEMATVYTYGDALNICSHVNPQNRTEAKFSLAYCVAAAARFGPLKPEHFDEVCLQDPSLQAAASKVRVVQCPLLSSAYPAHYGARVQMQTAAGIHEACVRDALGDPERPLSEDAIFDKAETLMAYGGVDSVRRSAIVAATRLLLKLEGSAPTQPMPPVLLDALF